MRLDEADLLYLVVGKFADIDLHPDAVGSLQMGYVFEELIRRFSEQSNETAGEHFTPREVIRLMVDLLFAGDSNELRTEGIVGSPLGLGVKFIGGAVGLLCRRRRGRWWR